MNQKHPTNCFCGSNAKFSGCCQAIIDGHKSATTAESLLRSRYSAYVRGNEQYLLDTWHPSTRPKSISLLGEAPVKWQSLKILKRKDGSSKDKHGIIEFVASYKINGKTYKLRETSEFCVEDGKWFYLKALGEKE